MDDLERDIVPLEDPEADNDSSSEDNASTASRKAKLPLNKPIPVDNLKESGFAQSTRVCLEQIREALLHHRWQEAAEYMAFYPQKLEDIRGGSHQQYKQLIWRISAEILHHHHNSKLDDYNNICERMKHSGVRHYLMICLEHSFHLLLSGLVEDARQQLCLAESWRYGRESTAQRQKVQLVQAYRSLLDYVLWCQKRATQTHTEHPEDHQEDVHTYFRQAALNLKEILNNPGVWDSFILSYVDMLEVYNGHEEALKVLSNYAYDNTFPPNPNAHVYLYKYLKRHNASEKKLMKALKVLHVLVPSHELMLEYSSLLLQSDREGTAQKALAVVLDMLDFACWRRDLDVWTRLKAIVKQLKLQKEWRAVVSGVMSGRKHWWPALHFTSFHAAHDSEHDPRLRAVKASLTPVLCPELTLKYSAGQTAEEEEEEEEEC